MTVKVSYNRPKLEGILTVNFFEEKAQSKSKKGFVKVLKKFSYVFSFRYKYLDIKALMQRRFPGQTPIVRTLSIELWLDTVFGQSKCLKFINSIWSTGFGEPSWLLFYLGLLFLFEFGWIYPSIAKFVDDNRSPFALLKDLGVMGTP